MTSERVARGVAIGSTLAVALAGLVVVGPSSHAASTIAWEPCTYEFIEGYGLECALLEVPMDRSDPGGPTFALAVARHPASGSPRDRIGSLVFNPGGPGGSGLDALLSEWSMLPESIRDRFDVVTWDPRGVGRTAPALAPCERSMDVDVPLTGLVDWRALGTQLQHELGPGNAACQEANQGLIEHIGTNEAVGDLEAIRQALGDERLTYWGQSYGTEIGYLYALAHPDRVRAILLDSPVDPAPTASSVVEGAVAPERAFTWFAHYFPASAKRYREVMRSLNTQPQWVAPGVLLNRWNAPYLVNRGLGNQSEYAAVARTIDTMKAAVFGSGAERWTARWRVSGWLRALEGDPQASSADASSAISCLDYPQRPSIEDVLPAVQQVARTSGRTAAVDVLYAAVMCAGYRFTPDPVPTLAAGAGPAVPLMVSGSTRDARTAGNWIRRMNEAFPASRAVVYRGSQHVVWTTIGSDCVDEPLTRYILTGRQPAADHSCPNTYAVGGLIE